MEVADAGALGMPPTSQSPRPASKLQLYTGSLTTYVSDVVRLTGTNWAAKATKLWAMPSAVPLAQPEPEPEPELRSGVSSIGPKAYSFHVRRVPMLVLKHRLLDRQATTVVTFDDGDGVVGSSLGKCVG